MTDMEWLEARDGFVKFERYEGGDWEATYQPPGGKGWDSVSAGTGQTLESAIADLRSSVEGVGWEGLSSVAAGQPRP